MTTQSQTVGGLNSPVLYTALAGIVVSLGLALQAIMTQGHASFNTTNDGVVWGLPIAVYVFFVLSSTGCTLVASLAMVFGMKDFYPIAKRCVWLAVATLIAGFVPLALELGHPFRMLWALPTSFQFTSPMNWMGVFYATYLVLLLLKFQKLNAEDWDSPLSRNLGMASFVTVIVAHGTLGLIFGMMAMRPFWYGSLIPLYFLTTAFLSGIAFAVMVTYISHSFDQNNMPENLRELMRGAMPKLFATVLGIGLLMVVFRTVTGLWSNADGLEVFHHMVRSPLFHIELWLGMLLPFVLLVSPSLRSRTPVQVACALLVMMALMIGRYEYVIGGQIVPLFKGAWAGAFVQYAPSFTEWMLALLGVSIAFAVYALGERLFRLSAEPGARS
jgi:molybdopterin-containing oxidoreductase family membrane subunit